MVQCAPQYHLSVFVRDPRNSLLLQLSLQGLRRLQGVCTSLDQECTQSIKNILRP